MSKVRLTKPQTRVWKSPARFKIVSAGRRFGKSYLALTWLVHNAMTKGGLHYYVAPSYVMAKQIAWRLLKELFIEHIKHKNESDLSVEFANGAVIQLKGAENRDSLRGVSLSSVCLDEASFMAREVWTDVIRPATSDKLAPVMFISSPSGFNWFKDLYEHGRNQDEPDWESFQFTTADGGNVTQEEIEAARRELPERTFKQEYLASFETLSNRVYSNFDRDINVSADIATIDSVSELHIGVDFNIDPITASVAVKVSDQLHIVDELCIRNSNTTELSQEIKKRYPNHKIRAYPDPSGNARKTSAAGGVTDFTILEQHGFLVLAPNKAPAVADRINEVQAMLCNTDGERRLFIHPRCKELIKGLDGMTYKEGTSQPDKSLGLDHITDALGYQIHSLFPIQHKTTSAVKIAF
ncbi:MAG: putative terminase large subunit [Prokaryotic dsDNA virus sp.]|nr:MAG: putative terminase large subunit [Prokaryotic dsDNA virus sp.]|tara:strand:- start:4807 stop:6036 length:1230 start_codon:yes stop_codon:yes gene_type:complete